MTGAVVMRSAGQRRDTHALIAPNHRPAGANRGEISGVSRPRPSFQQLDSPAEPNRPILTLPAPVIWGMSDIEITRFASDWTTGRTWPGSWNENATSWLDANRHAEVLLIQYDELKSAPADGIRAMAAFIGSPVSAERAEEISRQTSMADMMRLENNGKTIVECCVRRTIVALPFPNGSVLHGSALLEHCISLTRQEHRRGARCEPSGIQRLLVTDFATALVNVHRAAATRHGLPACGKGG